MERVLHGGHHHGDAQTHPVGALAQCAKGYVGGAGVGPLGTELVVGHPDAGQAHLFSIGDLVKHFQEPVSLVGRGMTAWEPASDRTCRFAWTHFLLLTLCRASRQNFVLAQMGRGNLSCYRFSET